MNLFLTKKTLFLLAFLSATFSVSFSVNAENLSSNEGEQAQAIENVITHSVNINHASAKDMAISFKGIGLKKAESIVAWREMNGEFTSINQLLEIRGIGQKILDVNRSKISL